MVTARQDKRRDRNTPDPVNFNNVKIRDEADPASYFKKECKDINAGYEAEILKYLKIPGV